MKCTLPQIRHDEAGFRALADLTAKTMHCAFADIEIDMSATNWFDADMCAAYGAILYRLGWSLNDITLAKLPQAVERILSKNGFLTHYGRESITDSWKTTIAYKRFDADDSQLFAEYVEREFLQRNEMPSMTSALQKRFRTSIFEIFSNSVIHSETRLGIFTCGQYYPKSHRLDFSMADLGIGIRKKVEDHLKTEIAPEEAIAWATQERNTTKRGPIPGGLGLKLLREFVDLNGGSIQIVSDAGYWRRQNCETHKAHMPHSFPGTVVTLEINTADSKNYMLSSERTSADLF